MCGLAGYSGSTPVNKELFTKILVDNQSRGRHSTGVYGRQLFKLDISADEFVKHDAYANALNGTHTVIGHTRFATTGAQTKENAHPFKVGEGSERMYGTHNGWLISELFTKTAEKFGLEPTTVDSELIFKILHTTNYDFDSLSEVEGAMALAFTKDEYLYLYRRSNKPLFIGIAPDGMGIYYSSKDAILRATKCTSIREIAPNLLYTYHKGVLVGYTQIKQPGINSIKLDEGRFSWSCTADESNKYPELKPKAISRHANWNKEVHGYIKETNHDAFDYGNYGHGGRGHQRQLPAASSALPANGKPHLNDGNVKNIRVALTHTLQLAESIEEALAQETIYEQIVDEVIMTSLHALDDQGVFVFVKLQDAGTKEALDLWTVYVDGFLEETAGITLANGYTALKLTRAMLQNKHTIKLRVYPPIEGSSVVFTGILKVSNLMLSSILEVVLNIPFSQSEEEKENQGRSNSILSRSDEGKIPEQGSEGASGDARHAPNDQHEPKDGGHASRKSTHVVGKLPRISNVQKRSLRAQNAAITLKARENEIFVKDYLSSIVKLEKEKSLPTLSFPSLEGALLVAKACRVFDKDKLLRFISWVKYTDGLDKKEDSSEVMCDSYYLKDGIDRVSPLMLDHLTNPEYLTKITVNPNNGGSEDSIYDEAKLVQDDEGIRKLSHFKSTSLVIPMGAVKQITILKEYIEASPFYEDMYHLLYHFQKYQFVQLLAKYLKNRHNMIYGYTNQEFADSYFIDTAIQKIKSFANTVVKDSDIHFVWESVKSDFLETTKEKDTALNKITQALDMHRMIVKNKEEDDSEIYRSINGIWLTVSQENTLYGALKQQLELPLTGVIPMFKSFCEDVKIYIKSLGVYAKDHDDYHWSLECIDAFVEANKVQKGFHIKTKQESYVADRFTLMSPVVLYQGVSEHLRNLQSLYDLNLVTTSTDGALIGTIALLTTIKTNLSKTIFRE